MNLDNIKQRTEVDKKLFTGLADLNVLAINPDAARIQEITGRDEVKEPEYGSFADDGTAKLRLDIWLANAELGISPFKHTIGVKIEKVLVLKEVFSISMKQVFKLGEK